VDDRKLIKSNQLKKYLKKKNPEGASSFVLKNLCHPSFPLFFILRNINWLQREAWWKNLSPRARRVNAARIIRERIVFFSQVKEWKRERVDPTRNDNPALRNLKVPNYCNKCGLCCEVASGMPDFPSSCELPSQWQDIFGNGLGRGHRFCPFLWEDNNSGGSLCSVYPWRSNPCRLFESDECDFFWKSPEPVEISSERSLLLVRRWLANLVNTGKLPLPTAYVPAKRPEFLELHGI
jgi:hypothetical protein